MPLCESAHSRNAPGIGGLRDPSGAYILDGAPALDI